MRENVEWYLPVSQVAEMLECHWREVHHLIDQGVLDSISIGPKKTRVSRSSVLKYLDAVHFPH